MINKENAEKFITEFLSVACYALLLCSSDETMRLFANIILEKKDLIAQALAWLVFYVEAAFSQHRHRL